MLSLARDQAEKENLTVTEVVWVPGAMEVPLALSRVINNPEIHGAACLGIIEKGETQHGLVMGQAVTKGIIDLQLASMKPIGYGIIGPGAKMEQINERLKPYARKAILAVQDMLSS